MIPRYLVLRERIEAELADIERAARKAVQAYEEARRSDRQRTFFLDSVAINLHSFYNGVERIFELLARELDGGLPTGTAWHRDLLAQMSLEVEGVRPAVIRAETAASLDEYLRFRHLVRNLYTWNFEEAKLAQLIAGLDRVLTDLKTDLSTFGRYLQAASRADEFPEPPPDTPLSTHRPT
jgi:hypothetical protein